MSNPQIEFRTPKWTPAALGGSLCLWLDASDAGTIAIGTGIATWHDKSPAKNHLTQATGANQPTVAVQDQNGKNVATFNGSTQYLSNATVVIPASLDFAHFAVLAPTNTGAYHNFYDNAAVVPMCWVDNTGNMEFNKNTASGGISSTASVDGTFSIYEGLCKSASQEYWKDGTAAGTAASTPLTAGSVSLTMFNRGGASTYNGKVAELLFISKSIDTYTRQKIEGYLAHKWGLQSKLVAGHPFRNSPP